MSQSIQIDMSGLHRQMQRLAYVTHKTTEQVMANQMGLLLRDSVKFTPPFGDAPIQESFNVQRTVGRKAVASQITSLFHPLKDSKVFEQESKLGSALRRLARKRDIVGLEAVLHRAKFTQEVVDEATADLHERNRGSWGRVTVRRPRYLVLNKPSINKLVRSEQAKVGLAKSGWWPAVQRVNGMRTTPINIPAWISRQPGSGYLVKIQSGGQVGFEAANLVPYIQKHVKWIMPKAAANRVRNLAKEVAIAERHYAAALRKDRL